MDLRTEANRLRLDVLAVALSQTLSRADVPHALLKGPSTANWLYAPPRSYADVDLLVPQSQVVRAARVLERAHLATADAGNVGEEAAHSWLLHSPEGFEVDLHISLPVVPPDGDRIWTLLASHLEPLELDVGTIPALDTVGRCLVLALHAVDSDPFSQPTEDLRRARQRCGRDVWQSVDLLAAQLGVVDLVDGGIARVEGVSTPLSHRAHLYLTRAPEAAIGLQRLADAPMRRLPALVWRELLPSRGFMRQAAHDPSLGGHELTMAHVRRWSRLARQLPAAVRARRSTRH